jgi:DNA-binding MarR family transcriptional regulator
VTTTHDTAVAQELLETLGLIRRHTRRRVGRPWPVEALSSAQVELLRVVARQPAISVATAATELGVAANTVSTLVRSLVSAGMLRRVPDPADRRIAQLHLTPTARRRVDRWRDARAQAMSAAIAALDTGDQAAITQALPALARLAVELRPEER